MGSLLSKPNVYADFSAQTFFTYPRELSEILRNWLEAYPDKVLFGTDAFSFGRSEEHTSELQSQSNLVCRLLLEKKKKTSDNTREQRYNCVSNLIKTSDNRLATMRRMY